MMDYYSDREYFVYRHVAPNGKMYVGITSQPEPSIRWGVGGRFYQRNLHFWNAIQKFGWDNFKHIIVAHGLSVDTACHLEKYLINKYDSMNNGYNQTSGGIYPTEVTDEIRNKIGTAVKNHRASLPKGEWASKFIGHKLSISTRKKISASHKGKTISPEVINKRVATFKASMTDERRERYRYLAKHRKISAETRAKLSKINTGKLVSEETRALMRQKAIQRNKEIDYIWVHRNTIERLIDSLDLYDYLDQGYELGRSNVELVYITKNNISKKVPSSDVENYILEGWTLGFSESRLLNIRKSQQKFIYTYNNITFNTGNEVAVYLRRNGYPKIAQGTVNAICQGITVPAYPELSVKLARRKIDEDT